MYLALLIFSCIFGFSSYANEPDFGDQIDLGLIEYDPITEASGVAASRMNPGVLWTHNDSGGSASVYALNAQGKHLGKYSIEGISNRDWEDMAVGPGPVDGRQYLYIGETGDMLGKRDLKYIYRFPEPIVDANQSPVKATITDVEKITFRYPDGRRDAETLMVDPLTKDIYIVSKWEPKVRVYRAPYPQSITDPITLDHVATLNLVFAVGGDISPAGSEILIKSYTNIFYWLLTPEQELWEAFVDEPVILPYVMEPQGEAVCWKSDGMGYYTISEETGGVPAHLYFYPRIGSPSVNVEPRRKSATTQGETKSKR